MANKKPQCKHCFGQNWIDLGIITPAQMEEIEGTLVETAPAVHIFQCGHGQADAEEMVNGCSRIITATEDRMNKGGVI